ncbi:MAG: hemolysin family protein [Planctomycetota bacterium]
MTDLTLLVSAGLLLAFSAFLSSGETALFSLSAVHHSRLRRERPVLGRKVLHLLQNSTTLLGTIIFVNVIVNTIYFSLSAEYMRDWLASDNFGQQAAAIYLPLLMLLVFGEVIPKILTLRTPFFWSHMVAYPLSWLMAIFGPIAGILTRFLPKERSTPSIGMKELESLVDESSGSGMLPQGEGQMIRGLLRFGYLTLEDVMVPRASMIMLRMGATRQEILSTFRTSGLSHIPVYTHVPDDIQGHVLLKDVIAKPDTELSVLVRPLHLFPAQSRLDTVFARMRRESITSALVIDEHGGVSGLIAYKDLLEEIVGEFSEDYGGASAQVIWTGGSSCRVQGHMTLRDFQSQTGQSIDGRGYLTVGGAVLAHLGHMPRNHETVVIGPMEITVDEIRSRRLEWAHISWGEITEES